MDMEKDTQITAENFSMEEAYQKYKKLKKIIMQWQEKQGEQLLTSLKIADKPPYLQVKDMPLPEIIMLWQELNNFANINISDEQLKVVWQEVILNKDKMDNGEVSQEVLLHLQLAINGIAQLVSKKVEQSNLDNLPYTNMTCPICGEVSTMTVLQAPNGNRNVHCLVCNYERPFNRTGCIYCGTTKAKNFRYLKNEAFPGVEVVVCEKCGQYFKEIDRRQLIVNDYLWEDLKTLPLNYATERWLTEHKQKNEEIH